MSKSKTPRKPNPFQQLVTQLVVVPSNNRTFWGREVRLANKLFKLYEKDFLFQIRPPSGYKVSSLMFFLTEEGRHFLTQEFFEYKQRTTNLVKKSEEVALAPDKIGNDISAGHQKPRTLKEFLKYGSKKATN
jgi:hypothetical protein